MNDNINTGCKRFLRQGIDMAAAGDGDGAKTLVLPGHRKQAGNRVAHAAIEERQLRGLPGLQKGMVRQAQIILRTAVIVFINRVNFLTLGMMSNLAHDGQNSHRRHFYLRVYIVL